MSTAKTTTFVKQVQPLAVANPVISRVYAHFKKAIGDSDPGTSFANCDPRALACTHTKLCAAGKDTR